MRAGSIYNIVLSVTFVAVIGAFAVAFFVLEPQLEDERENRALKQFPVPNIEYLDPWPKEFEAYYNDQFPFRNDIIYPYSKAFVKLFRESPIPEKVLIANNQWLFLSGPWLDYHLGDNLFSDSACAALVEELEYRNAYCEERGIDLYFAIVPRKHTIYREQLPPFYRNQMDTTQRHQVMQALADHPSVKVIDLTPVILEQKGEQPLYYKTDDHWNFLAGFHASNALLELIAQDHPEVGALSRDDYVLKEKARKPGPLAQWMNMGTIYEDREHLLEPKDSTSVRVGEKQGYAAPEAFPYKDMMERVYENPEGAALKIMVVGESFTDKQVPFIPEAFERSVFIFDGWQHKLNETIIESEKPDVVVIQVVEDQLESLLNFRSSP